MEEKTKHYVILGGLFLYIILLRVFYEQIATSIVSGSLLQGFFLFLLGSPTYILALYFIIRFFPQRAIWKRTIAGILVAFSLDWISFPRLLPLDKLLDGANTVASPDSLVMRFLEQYMPHAVAYEMFYTILPMVFLFISLELLGIINLVKTVKEKMKP
jgi:hypothetical protein